MEYPKIETLYVRDESTFKVKPGVFKNRVYEIIKTWHWTEKIDGTNIRIIYNPPSIGSDDLIFGVRGRTDRANLPGDLVSNIFTRELESKLAENFQCPVVLYGEGYGAGIQRGAEYSSTKKFILFDILVDGKWWLNQDSVDEIAVKLGLEVVPKFGEWTIEEATEFVRRPFESQLGKTQAEGLVGRTVEPLFDKKGSRLIVKLKTKDF
jgi:ATP-dependent RNA circularization protein (DNA/RNA ligase family)